MDEVPREYFQAGQIAAAVREEAKKMVDVGQSVLEICERIEAKIREKGGEPAFPCNIDINEVAAHYTAAIEDKQVVRPGDVVKIDVGVHIGGFIADTAATISLDPHYDPLLAATEEALKRGLAVVKPGVRTGEVGRVVGSVAAQMGYTPISNLGGHLLESYTIHAGKAIPNIWVPNTPTMKAGEVYAVEPFLTQKGGAGSVAESHQTLIYSLGARKRVGAKELGELVDYIWQAHRTLPFAARWLTKAFGKNGLQDRLDKLTKLKVLRAYPVLVEASGRVVAQFEHTVALTQKGTVILTAA